ncbi:MAG: ABC transporter permease subunit [Saprospiraceae bacterium]|nr:ABC transporter permease subunit [Saprospiraceae bacterium]
MKIIRYVLYDILRSRMIIGYTAFLLLVSAALFATETNASKSILNLLNIVLIVVPLVSIVFTTIHYYNSYQFIELMLAQPIERMKLLLSEFLGVILSLSAAFLIGIGLPVLLFSADGSGISLLISGILLTFIFSSIAFWVAAITQDKAKGIGVTLLLWFYFSLIYDFIVLFLMFTFSDYPLEKAMLGFTALNPIDLGRVFVMLQMDVSALMGYTGAVYKQFFGSALGMFFALGVMIMWAVVPLFLAIRVFKKKDF